MFLILPWLCAAVCYGTATFCSKWRRTRYHDWWELLYITTVICVIVGIGCLVVYPIAYYGYRGDIQAFNSLRATVETARDSASEIESATIQLKIIEANQWLSSTQYHNSTILGVYIPDEVDNLEPIR